MIHAQVGKSQMEFNCWKKSYNTFGGSSLYSPIASLLTVKVGDVSYGDAIQEIDITANLRSTTRNPRPTLESLFDQYHEYIESLPLVTFRRKKQKMEIHFLSEEFSDQDDINSNASVENLHLAAKEVADSLSLIRKRIKKSDDFDGERFLADATQILGARIGSDDEWTQIEERAREIDQAVLATKSPWELLEIDWDKFHPQAREILDEPFYWACTDDFAPHGNDTGADLLDDFRRWNRKSPKTSPLKFLDRLLQQWGIQPIDWLVIDPKSVAKLYHDDPISLQVCNEAAIGLAFAVIKMRAKCPADVAEYGLAALKRSGTIIRSSDLSTDLKSEWKNAEAKLATKLKASSD